VKQIEARLGPAGNAMVLHADGKVTGRATMAQSLQAAAPCMSKFSFSSPYNLPLLRAISRTVHARKKNRHCKKENQYAVADRSPRDAGWGR